MDAVSIYRVAHHYSIDRGTVRDGLPPNGLCVGRHLEGTRSIDRDDVFAASGCENRPDPGGRLHAHVRRRGHIGKGLYRVSFLWKWRII
jgi:hypothetical protein